MADIPKFRSVKEHGMREILLSASWVPETRTVLAGASDGGLYRFDLAAEKLEPVKLEGHTSYVMGVAALGATRVVSGGYDRRLLWWDLETGSVAQDIPAHEKWIRGVVASSDGKLVASVADDMVCRIWNADGKPRHELRGHEPITPHHFPSMLYCCAFSPTGEQIATADRVGNIKVWNTVDGKLLAEMAAPEMYTWDPRQRIHAIGGIRSLAFSADGRLLAAGGMGQVGNIDHLGGVSLVQVFDWQKQESTLEYKGEPYKGLVEHLQFDPQGKWLLAAGGDNSGFYQLIDLATGKTAQHDKAPMHVHAVAVDAQHATFCGVGHGKLTVWEWA